MSVVNAAGKRGPGFVRAVVKLSLGCVLLGGCSSGSERFASLEFGSGYQPAPSSSQVSRTALTASPNAAAPASSQYTRYAAEPPAPASQPPAGGYQLASAAPSQSGGYLQVSRVDLPPLQQQQAAPALSGVKTADGYGRYGPPPLADGEYTGPRIYTPYDQPRADYTPPPPPPPDEPRYDRDAPPPAPPPDYYRRSESETPPYPPRGEARVYEPRPDYRDGPRYDGPRGKVVTVQRGDTLFSIAIRNGVTVDMIVRANGLSSRTYVKPGTELIIPQAGPTRLGDGQGETPKAQTAECKGDQCYTVRKGETVASIARAHGVSEAQVLEANNLPNARSLKAGQTITIPSREAPRRALASAAPNARASSPAVPAAEPTGGTLKAPEALPAPEAKPAALKPAEPSCDAALANPVPRTGMNFRKPVDGRIVGQFGQQPDGAFNEGVTIPVPKGTPIRAAENGVVAYVGDELPGFGNLILIRHADEYVTAYAHADEILVKKCDVVKRGQVVAKAGATGDASQPQLHFEIRKNAKPVDPGPLLGS